MAAEVLARVKSDTSDNEYEIRLGRDGVVYCTCWGWKRYRNCKHLKAFHANNMSGRATEKVNGETLTLEIEIDKVVEMLRQT